MINILHMWVTILIGTINAVLLKDVQIHLKEYLNSVMCLFRTKALEVQPLACESRLLVDVKRKPQYSWLTEPCTENQHSTLMRSSVQP